VRPHVPTRSRAPLVAVVVLAVTMLVALPAGAHPFVRGGEVPVDSVATLTLAMAHGCGSEDAGGGDPTLEIALEVPDAVRIVAVADDPSYEHELEAAGGRIEVVTWTAIDGGEPAPDVEFDAVFTGEPGGEVYLRVFQGCDGFAYRWVGTPDDPADDPAVRLTLVAADPDAPAPAPDETTPAEAEAAPAPEATEEDPGTATDTAEDADDTAADETAAEDAADATDEPADAGDAEAAAEDDGGFPIWLVGVVVVVGIGIGIVLALRARRPGGGPPEGGDAPAGSAGGATP
jgi:uncharacterized protein YcnI